MHPIAQRESILFFVCCWRMSLLIWAITLPTPKIPQGWHKQYVLLWRKKALFLGSFVEIAPQTKLHWRIVLSFSEASGQSGPTSADTKQIRQDSTRVNKLEVSEYPAISALNSHRLWPFLNGALYKHRWQWWPAYYANDLLQELDERVCIEKLHRHITHMSFSADGCNQVLTESLTRSFYDRWHTTCVAGCYTVVVRAASVAGVMWSEKNLHHFRHILQWPHLAGYETYKVIFSLESRFLKFFFELVPNLFIRIQLRRVAW